MRLLRPEGLDRTGSRVAAGRRPGVATPSGSTCVAAVRTPVVVLAVVLTVAGCGTSANWLAAGNSEPNQTQRAALNGRAEPGPSGSNPAALRLDATDQPDAAAPSGPEPTRSAPAPAVSTPVRIPGHTTRSSRSTPRTSSARATTRPRVTTTQPRVKAGSTATSRSAAAGSGVETAVETEVIRLVNVQRATAGCTPVTVNPILVTVARTHSVEMSTQIDGVKHNSLDGRTPFQRMLNAGYSYSMAAENVAGGQASAASVMTAWMNSPGHQANILNCQLSQIGVGMYYRAGSQYGTYWTQDFGTPM